MAAAWKEWERRVAKWLGGRRSGARGEGVADVIEQREDWISAECKHRKELPKWLDEWIAQAKTNAEPGQCPVIFVHVHRQPYLDGFVILPVREFLDRFVGSVEE